MHNSNRISISIRISFFFWIIAFNILNKKEVEKFTPDVLLPIRELLEITYLKPVKRTFYNIRRVAEIQIFEKLTSSS